MSIEHLREALRCDIGLPGPRFVYFVLCDAVDKGGSWIIEVEAIAAATAIAPSTVRKHLTWLEENGYIRGERQRHKQGWLGGYRWHIVQRSNRAVGISAETEAGEGEAAEQPALKSSGRPSAQIEQSLALKSSGHIPPQDTPPTTDSDESVTGARAHAPRFDDFGRFWDAFPNRVGQGKARRVWGQLVEAGSLPALAEVLARVEAYRVGKPANREWLNPASWLVEERWLDDPPDDGPGRRSSPSSASSAMPPITVPEDLHAAVAEGCGAAWAASYLSGAVVEDGRLRPRSGLAWDKLNGSPVVKAELARRGLGLVKPEPAAVR